MNEIIEAALKPFVPAPQFKEGDIFRWRYIDEPDRTKRDGWTNTYWCKSQMAVVRNGRLEDTYWYSGSDNSRLDPAKVVLTFLGNPADMKQISSGEKVYYKPEDVVDMGHPNASGAPVYVKAERDPETMKAYYRECRERFEREERMARDRIKDCDSAIAVIERGDMAAYLPLYRI